MSERIDCTGWVYSDDVSGWWVKADQGREDGNEKWLPLFLGEQKIGQVRLMWLDGGWEIHLRGIGEERLTVRGRAPRRRASAK